MEPLHLEQQLELRQRQLQEIAGTFRVSHAIPRQHGTQGQTRTQFRVAGLKTKFDRARSSRPRGATFRSKGTSLKRSRVPSADPLLGFSTPFLREIYLIEL